MEYINTALAADKWKMTERRVTMLCREGKISGAKKEGKYWMIPETAKRPEDGRKRGFSQLMMETTPLPLPIGESDFKNIINNYYYVDKTLMIKEFIDTMPKVSLFTRPRRFGKTLAMDMFKTFFEISAENNSMYFKDKKYGLVVQNIKNIRGSILLSMLLLRM